MDARLPKDPAIDYLKLGSFQAEYGTGSSRHYAVIVTMIVLAALCACGVAVFVGIYFADPQIPGVGIAGMVVFGVLAIFPLVGLFFYLDKLAWRVLLFSNGFVMDRNKRFEMILWDQIKTVFEKRALIADNDASHWVRLEMMSGNHISLDQTFPDITALAQRIREGSQPSLLSRALARLGLKEPLSFGNLKIYPDGLANGKERIKWDLVESIAIEPGSRCNRVLIRKKGEQALWYQQAGPECPNMEMLAVLANRLRQPPPPSEPRTA
jgi:hypothetical protein